MARSLNIFIYFAIAFAALAPATEIHAPARPGCGLG
jgi:hypothetical protein